MPGRGLGDAAFGGYDIGEEDLLDRPDTDTHSSASVNDYFWGGGPPPVTQIPYAWLSPAVRFRPDPPINVADVTQISGTSAHSVNRVSVATYGEYAPSPVQLATLCDADPSNLAVYTTGNYANPRTRCPQLTLNLLSRTDVECWLILGREIGNRIQITDAPSTWPEGTTSLVIEGIQHAIAVDMRLVTWDTSPIVGASPGVPGPWFRADSSRVDGTDKIPF